MVTKQRIWIAAGVAAAAVAAVLAFALTGGTRSVELPQQALQVQDAGPCLPLVPRRPQPPILLAALLRVKFLVDRLKCDEGIVTGGWRKVVREHFRKHGFEVLEATNQAIAIVGKNGR